MYGCGVLSCMLENREGKNTVETLDVFISSEPGQLRKSKHFASVMLDLNEWLVRRLQPDDETSTECFWTITCTLEPIRGISCVNCCRQPPSHRSEPEWPKRKKDFILLGDLGQCCPLPKSCLQQMKIGNPNTNLTLEL